MNIVFMFCILLNKLWKNGNQRRIVLILDYLRIKYENKTKGLR